MVVRIGHKYAAIAGDDDAGRTIELRLQGCAVAITRGHQ